MDLPFTRNALFTGRTEILGKLESLLIAKADTCAVVAGMDGVGKTQLAIEFGYRSGHHFKGVHWLNLMDPVGLDAEIAACGQEVGLAYEKQPEQVAATLKFWQNNGPRLLILDNFEAVSKSTTLLARLQQAGLRLLVTSRRDNFPVSLGWAIFPLGSFNPYESQQFLRSRVPYDRDQAADLEQLAKKLGHLPLALELAASYLETIQVPPAEYLAELEETLVHESMQAEWFQELEIASPTGHLQSLLATFQVSWAQVQRESAQKVFKLVGYLAPNVPIPLEILRGCFESEAPALTKKTKAPKTDPVERTLRRDLHRLSSLGLLQFSDGAHSIHPLLAAYARILNTDTDLLKKLSNSFAKISENINENEPPAQLAALHKHGATLTTHTKQVG